MGPISTQVAGLGILHFIYVYKSSTMNIHLKKYFESHGSITMITCAAWIGLHF